MKSGVARLALGTALLAIVFAAPASASTISARGGNKAERTFVHWLRQHHPGYVGPSVCPTSHGARETNGGIRCVAEIHRGRRYVQVWAHVSTGSAPRVEHPASGSWIRRWSKYTRLPQHISPGLISVNASLRFGFDWRWLLLGVDYFCRQKHHQTCTASALDGQWAGYQLFYTFRCRVHGKLIACHNKLGDAVRWRPHAHASH